MTAAAMCQSCLTAQVQTSVDNDGSDRPFLLCSPCALRLQNRALRPVEWYRLAALHGPFCYLLNDDFYDQAGTAFQNEIPMHASTLFRAPLLDEVREDLSLLIDFALTRWHLSNDLIVAFGRFSTPTLLDALEKLVTMRPTIWVERRCYEIVGHAVGPAGRSWMEARWDAGTRAETIYTYLSSIALCCPPDEVIERAIMAVQTRAGPDRATMALCLARFRSRRVLDWIKAEVRSPVGGSWGLLAACSNFSWPVAVEWLTAGRPLSLVALDALVILRGRRGPHQSQLVAELDPVLGEAPTDDEIVARLLAYQHVDDVPRVANALSSIRRGMDQR